MKHGKTKSTRAWEGKLCVVPAKVNFIVTLKGKWNRTNEWKHIKYSVLTYIVHLPWGKGVRSAQDGEKIVGPKVISNITENYDPEISLPEHQFCSQSRCKTLRMTINFEAKSKCFLL